MENLYHLSIYLRKGSDKISLGILKRAKPRGVKILFRRIVNNEEITAKERKRKIRWSKEG